MVILVCVCGAELVLSDLKGSAANRKLEVQFWYLDHYDHGGITKKVDLKEMKKKIKINK